MSLTFDLNSTRHQNVMFKQSCPGGIFWDSRGSGSGLSVPENSDFGSDLPESQFEIVSTDNVD